MKNLRELHVTGKRVLVRVDFNVPMNDQGAITDDLRIRMVLPTLEYLLGQNAKIILCSHLGRPKGQRAMQFSLGPAAARLGKLLGKNVVLAPDCIGPEVENMAMRLKDGELLMLENLRFHPEEEKNEPKFAQDLAKLGEVYVNDAFAVSHRAHASVVGVPHSFPEKAPGFLLQNEIDYFHRAFDVPIRPLVALVGGAKVSDKLNALKNILNKVDKLILGGAMANTFLKSQGYELGASKVEDDLLETAQQLLQSARAKGVKVYLPVDVIAASEFAPDAVGKAVTVQDIPPGWMALDIGPASVTCFKEVLADAKTIVWNGPMGAFEMDAFARGTMAIAHEVASAHALSVTGGGDSNAAIEKAGEAGDISYMSTGGGAFLELMEGKMLPGIEALE